MLSTYFSVRHETNQVGREDLGFPPFFHLILSCSLSSLLLSNTYLTSSALCFKGDVENVMGCSKPQKLPALSCNYKKQCQPWHWTCTKEQLLRPVTLMSFLFHFHFIPWFHTTGLTWRWTRSRGVVNWFWWETLTLPQDAADLQACIVARLWPSVTEKKSFLNRKFQSLTSSGQNSYFVGKKNNSGELHLGGTTLNCDQMRIGKTWKLQMNVTFFPYTKFSTVPRDGWLVFTSQSLQQQTSEPHFLTFWFVESTNFPAALLS